MPPTSPMASSMAVVGGAERRVRHRRHVSLEDRRDHGGANEQQPDDVHTDSFSAIRPQASRVILSCEGMIGPTACASIPWRRDDGPRVPRSHAASSPPPRRRAGLPRLGHDARPVSALRGGARCRTAARSAHVVAARSIGRAVRWERRARRGSRPPLDRLIPPLQPRPLGVEAGGRRALGPARQPVEWQPAPDRGLCRSRAGRDCGSGACRLSLRTGPACARMPPPDWSCGLAQVGGATA